MYERNYHAVCEKHDWQSSPHQFKCGAQAARSIHNEKKSSSCADVAEVGDE